jgi:multisubunit Na+/H+ antiporter MnhB subunit
MDRSNRTDPVGSPPVPGVLRQGLAALLALLLCGGLCVTVWFLPAPETTLPDLVQASLPASGVANPVTAVLLNFRGYDTLLELVVLLLTALAARAVAGAAPPPRTLPPLADPVLAAFLRVLVPLSILIAGYVLWAGKHAPGGAFQAGSILASIGVLAALTTRFPSPAGTSWQPAALVFGPFAFCAVGLGTMWGQRSFLEYPTPGAGPLILFIEAAATVSIATALVTLFLGCLHGPRTGQDSTGKAAASYPSGGKP